MKAYINRYLVMNIQGIFEYLYYMTKLTLFKESFESVALSFVSSDRTSTYPLGLSEVCLERASIVS